ncbi:hypothetical protein [Streptomyces hokutonensis]|uniref:hypothetical protein n=1 Tax=Streptomyces hokutonensis TaxID=1306990 RepID=UPI0033F569E4
MTGPNRAEGAFRNRCASAAKLLAPFVNHFIARVSFEAQDDEESLEITLRDGPERPEAIISLAGLRHVGLSKGPGISGYFVDAICVTHLPRTPLPWPEEAAALVRRFDGLEELVWLRLVGPAEIDVIASIVTVYVAMSDDEASTDPTTV